MIHIGHCKRKRLVRQSMQIHNVFPIGYPCERFNEDHEEPTVICDETPDCFGEETARYRRINGRCNNLQNPKWGSSGWIFNFIGERNPVTDPEGDELMFRSVRTGNILPNVRKVSVAIHGSKGSNDPNIPKISILVMQYGQFLDHDLTLTPQAESCRQICGATDGDPRLEECCDWLLFYSNTTRPDHCWPIPVDPNDPIFLSQSQNGGQDIPRCIEFKRSMVFQCRREPHQFNEVTHFLDASNVYGSSDIHSGQLRGFINGYMRHNQFSRDTLPYRFDSCNDAIERTERPIMHPRSYVAGDFRVNESPGLQALHTLWVREHNRLAEEVKGYFPSKTDEEIYQETKRYVVAQWQHITYDGFLRLVLGQDAVDKYKLDTMQNSEYKKDQDPTVFTEFSTAAFRFGHSLITDLIKLFKLKSKKEKTGEEKESLQLFNNFFNPEILIRKKMSELVLGMTHQEAEKADARISTAVREHLFQRPNQTFGSDLASLNIQRGRDHSIASYDMVRRICGLPGLPQSFGRGSRPVEIPSDLWDRFSELYDSPLDIELFPAGLAEIVAPGELVGPIFKCIIGRQFKLLREGDRYFFTHSNVDEAYKFCDKEKEAVRKRTMRDVLCDNDRNDKNHKVAVDPFHVVDEDSNPLEDCKTANKLNIRDLCLFGGEDPEVDPTTETNEDGSDVLMLAGGFDGESVLKTIELYHPEGKCNMKIADLPKARYGLVMVQYNNTVFACGGDADSDGTYCYRYLRDEGIGSWEKSDFMQFNSPRFMAAMGAGKLDKVVFVSGGFGDKTASSTIEYLDIFSGEWYRGPQLPDIRIRHCLLMVPDELNLVSIGGFLTGTKVENFDDLSNEWKVINTTVQYNDRHSCIFIPGREKNDEILIVGDRVTPSIFNRLTGEERLTRGSKSVNRGFGAAVGLDNMVFLVGGEKHSPIVEKYDSRTETFSRNAVPLLSGRSRFGYTVVPANWFSHLGCK